jgi:WD40 repeat protein
MRHILSLLVFCVSLSSCCTPSDVQQANMCAPIYPDYADVTIPINIAPLNFLLRNHPQATYVKVTGKLAQMIVKGGCEVQFPEKKWKTFLNQEAENTVIVEITALINDQWIGYKPFEWHIVSDKLDPYLSYRLIEPGYEVWNNIQLRERNVESFDERVIADNNLTEHSCMNCHIYGNQNPALSMFHLRGIKGGTILNRNGKLRKINTRTDKMMSPAIYGNFHPSGRYAVFSTNIIIPELHAYRTEKLEVYDTASDIVITDFDNNKIIRPLLLTGNQSLETFPTFSADGKWIYFCTASATSLPDSIKQMKYNLCRISFDENTQETGSYIDTLFSAKKAGKSVCHLKCSPDGKYILYTVADYGTFPIWHPEADLQMMNLQNGNIDSLTIANGPFSDSYHSWSSNSRWFVFASKRDNGIYGKPYFCYIDIKGKAHKPFVLPQYDPTTYDYMLKSFNIPELSTGKLPFDAMDIERIFNQQQAEQMTEQR